MNNEFVVLLHGLLRSATDMALLAKYLEKQGYQTANILYPSRKMRLEDLTAFVADKIAVHPGFRAAKTLHFVTHSMGGLIVRYYLAARRPEHLGRVVMLSPPNTGSELADILHGNKILGPVFRAVFGPAGAQLKTDYRHPDGAIDYPLGIIAGSGSINPLAPWMLKGGHDGIVPVERTKIPGMHDHIVIRATHSFMMFNPKVMRQVACFLKDGRFDHG